MLRTLFDRPLAKRAMTEHSVSAQKKGEVVAVWFLGDYLTASEKGSSKSYRSEL